MRSYLSRLLLLFPLALFSCAHDAKPPPSAPEARCYLTGGGELEVCHASRAEGRYYDTPDSEVAYNVQVLRLKNGAYATIYHGDSYPGVVRSGDSLKAGVEAGPFSYRMPKVARVIHGTLVDQTNPIYNGFANNPFGASGGANPTAVKGFGNDPYYYLFFLGVTGGSDAKPNGWHHVMLGGRTKDFKAFDILGERKGQRAWIPFGGKEGAPGRKPVVLRDTAGSEFAGHHSAAGDATQGLIGSVAAVNKTYYFFYYDTLPEDPQRYALYYRTAKNLSRAEENAWSPERRVGPHLLTGPSIVRVAKAKGMDRWMLAYNCYRPTDHLSDICVQYTKDLSVEGASGLGGIEFADSAGPGFYLGLNSGTGLRSQHYFMTDEAGALATPKDENAGFLTWLDLNGQAIYGADVYWAEWNVRAR